MTGDNRKEYDEGKETGRGEREERRRGEGRGKMAKERKAGD